MQDFRSQLSAQASIYGLDLQVNSEGPINSRIVIIGEGPGETEIRQGKPFVGGAGKLLWDALRKYNFHRANVYTTNVVKRQISLSRKGNERNIVHRQELDYWIGLTRWELEHLPNVDIIFALGNYAMEALAIPGTDRSGITKWRGSVMDHVLPNGRPVKVVLSINPAYALRDLTMEPPFLMDCHKLYLVANGKYRKHEIEHIINPSLTQSLDYIRKLKSDNLPVAYDIENMHQPQIVCFGLSNNAHEGICINLRDQKENRFTLKEEVTLHYALQDLFDSVPIIAQNADFDYYYSWYRNYLLPEAWFDTMLAHHTLYPRLPHDLGFLTTQYTLHPYYKDDSKIWREGGDLDSYWRYNATDAALTFAIHQKLKHELEQQKLDDFFFNHVMRLQPHLVQATVHGIAIDLEARQKAIEESAENLAKLEAEVTRLATEAYGGENPNINWRSRPQVAHFWFDQLQLRGRGRSTDAANREQIIKNPRTPPIAKEMLTAYNAWAKESKFNSTYAEMRLDPDGRFRASYKQHGVARAPGRLSSSKNAHGTAMNIQNQPERARQQFVSDPGTVFIYFDLSQAEARVVAYLANIPKWKEQYEQARLHPNDKDYDTHRRLAADMFSIPLSEMPLKDFDTKTGTHTIRYVAKRCRHGLNYRMQEDMLAEVTKLPYHEAKRAFHLYHQAHPELRAWWEETERRFRIEREIWTPLGRRYKIIQRLDDDTLRSLVALIPQSTVGDFVKKVWYLSHEDPEWPTGKARIALNNHDALVGMATPDVALKALAIMKKHAETPLLIQNVYRDPPEELILPAECKMSTLDIYGEDGSVIGQDTHHRWSNLKDVEV